MYKVTVSKSAFKMLMPLLLMNIAWIKDIPQRFTKMWNLVLDACPGTFSVSKTCMHPPKLWKFIECKEALSCVTEVIPLLIQIYACQVMSRDSYLDVDKHVRGFSKCTSMWWKGLRSQHAWIGGGFRTMSFHKNDPNAHLGSAEYLYRRAKTVLNGRKCSSSPVEPKMTGKTEYIQCIISSFWWP